MTRLHRRETLDAMRLALVLLAIAACRRPLAPGETRCYSTPAGNSYVTQCKTAPNDPPPALVKGFYCTVRSDGFGACQRTAVACERVRYADEAFSPCARQEVAICLATDCFSDRQSCERYADHSDRDRTEVCTPSE